MSSSRRLRSVAKTHGDSKNGESRFDLSQVAVLDARKRHRRIVLVVISAVVTFALACAYVVGDIVGVVPGALTMQASQQAQYETASNSIGAAEIIDNVDLNKPVDAARAQSAIKELLNANGVGSDLSVAVAQANGDPIASHEIDKTREPASTLKTLTSLAAASKLDMGSTLPTQVFLQQQGNTYRLVLKGNGDMLLSAGDSDPNHINGRAGLRTLAKQTAHALQSRGISKVTLDYDDALFSDQRTPSALSAAGDMSMYYTGVSSMAIDGGRQRSEALSNPDVFHDYPELSQHTAADVAEKFKDLLHKQGINAAAGKSVKMNNASSANDAAANASSPTTAHKADATQQDTPIAQVESAPLSAVMMFMLRHSDNTLAEEFGRLLALRLHEDNSPAGAVQSVTKVLKELGVPTQGLHMSDCSGLSPGSRVSVRTLVAVQQQNLHAGNAVAAAEGLAVAGLNGTVQYRLANSENAGLMRMKTGTLNAVTSLTGNISRRQGGVLAFSVIVNNPSDTEAAKAAIDRFASSLASL
ncbi:D-alanyl-D-alanine carboxypeptidase [Bifidobacterium dolichotidis]|uniref:D-alanyl-D-alanine carboxypeptidase n=1 Tax=Bifidobacterium dolichotidis TaxID=2306976 RepID=A0A430FPY4_9BIFI|nr:D-alanyl-D-alanine carboxypeptidase/D-alanyl-D-alanine-endopeptidase [Bifidobacterium dolichotidis]RSX54891.1 D-alanyl-D-alanine carboxypeptidase [Bifidobacterium dolichotidis]